jgi:copper oxidase (laccase) domain-containing protein
LYAHRETHGPAGRSVDLAFTDRYGGVSVAPFDSLNLALEGDDDPASCRVNLHRVLDDFAPGDVFADVRQVHGAAVDVVEDRHTSARPEADGIVTTRASVVLAVRAAGLRPRCSSPMPRQA